MLVMLFEMKLLFAKVEFTRVRPVEAITMRPETRGAWTMMAESTIVTLPARNSIFIGIRSERWIVRDSMKSEFWEIFGGESDMEPPVW